MAELGAFFGNPNLQRQGARARALAAQRDVNTLADPRTYAIVQGLLGTAPDQMGFSVLNPNYEKIKKVAEPAFALGLLGQASPLLAPMTKGLPVGASIKNVGDDLLSYRGSHKAPSPDFGAPLHDLTGGGQMYPADVYSAKATQFYGTGYPKADKEAFDLAKRVRGNPDAEVTMYRAVPKDENIKTINAGDWVTLSKDYAKTHGESALMGDYKIISQKVKAKELWTNADSIHEFGYQPQKKATAPQQEALDTAQRNAALPIEEGGLGLPKDNTPEMRAQAMGFDTPVYHATDVPEDFSTFIPSTKGKLGAGIYTSPSAKYTEKYVDDNARIMPLLTRGNYANEDVGAEIADKIRQEMYDINPNFAVQEWKARTSQELKNLGYAGKDVDKERVVFAPENLRSRFAAFDPKRRNEPDILAGVLPLGLLADEEQRKKLYELMPSLLGE